MKSNFAESRLRKGAGAAGDAAFDAAMFEDADPGLRMLVERAKKALSPEEALPLVKENGMLLKYLPDQARSLDVEMAAVSQNPDALEYAMNKTAAVCMIAVKQDGRALRHVSEQLLTPELCMAAVKSGGASLADVPEPWRTEEICSAAVKEDGRALQWMPDVLKTEALCMEAVNCCSVQDVEPIVPDYHDGRELAALAVGNKKMAEEVSKACAAAGKVETLDEALATLQSDVYLFKALPKKFQCDQRVCDAFFAACKNPNCISDLPPENITMSMMTAAVAHNPENIKHLPEKMETQKNYEELFAIDSNIVKYMPSQFITRDVYVYVFATNKEAFAELFKNERLPDEWKTKKMCEEMVAGDGLLFRYVPDRLKTLNMLESMSEESEKLDKLINGGLASVELMQRKVRLDKMIAKYDDSDALPAVAKMTADDIVEKMKQAGEAVLGAFSRTKSTDADPALKEALDAFPPGMRSALKKAIDSRRQEQEEASAAERTAR